MNKLGFVTKLLQKSFNLEQTLKKKLMIVNKKKH